MRYIHYFYRIKKEHNFWKISKHRKVKKYKFNTKSSDLLDIISKIMDDTNSCNYINQTIIEYIFKNFDDDLFINA